MYLLFITLVFSLALGPDVMLLKAQMANTDPMSVMQSVSSPVTETSPGINNATGKMELTSNDLISEAEKVKTSEEHMMSTQELLTSSEPLTTAESTTIFVHNTMMTNDLSSPADPYRFTTNSMQDESMVITTTTEPFQTPSPSPTILLQTSMSIKPEVSTPTMVEVETTDTSPNNTPTPTSTTTNTPIPIPTTTPTTMPNPTPTTKPTTMPYTTPTITPTTMPNTTPTITPTFMPTTTQGLSTLTSLNSTYPEEMSSTNSGMSSLAKDTKKEANWLIISVIALVIFCILTTLCVMIIVIKRRRQSGHQNFGHMTGQRSKKKKVTEDDVWAGPVKLGGRDCEGPEEVEVQGEEKKTDGVELTGLSTFTTLEENGGVGRPGSTEVKQWEEKEPLLFIDEEGKEKRNEAGKSEDADAEAAAGKTDKNEAEPNGGETFCLTTAV
ncbi:hepatitis A virus cellular receptor 1 [Tachysurus fulvidraco]|uniref:hepatitis A virus cellular receptor 1 n=1 Tax=Tachysurus fulvidraco TaxID=1234273 RepID=UPI001FEF427C|nr:hepatitis A virus cellular receptor 1 [Tachysurus fulvidraco]